MAKEELYDIPTRCPITGENLYVSEITSSETGVTIRGMFKVPAVSKLDDDQLLFLETFLRARGVILTMEKELGISYPTVRARLDNLLEAMGLTPFKEREGKAENNGEGKRKILKQLEDGKITAAEAKEKLRGLNSK